jgi:hypothetical protein
MQIQPSDPRAGDGPRLERAIVLQLLRDDHGPEWSRDELLAELGGAPAPLDEAVGRLHGDGILSLAEEGLSASRAARRLDELGLIAL